ncbi:hypothetical protein LGN19_33240 [Burkholderia sp. AU30198]|uniref:hypothetical protein n=1 Tax=Burkholderia sp. AU30198 TaxID=2879627 RepID=UPI001CF40F2A|nr:hypothetical protein [Burkholderia sp. AU30198]MCA8298662.1 hypothetical protein [Burkholderia sp. AU30198]
METTQEHDEQLRESLLRDWHDHTKQPTAVAARLRERLAFPMDAQDLVELAALATHVFGEHLGDWQAGMGYLDQLVDAHEDAPADSLRRIDRQHAVLERLEDANASLDRFDADDRVYITALALPAITLQRSVAEAETAFAEAMHLLASSDCHEHHRLFGVVTANLVCDLLDRSALSAARRRLLVVLAEKSHALWLQEGDETDREKAAFRLMQSYQKCRTPDNYGSGRYPRYGSIEP